MMAKQVSELQHTLNLSLLKEQMATQAACLKILQRLSMLYKRRIQH
jgi:hypothetical protein